MGKRQRNTSRITPYSKKLLLHIIISFNVAYITAIAIILLICIPTISKLESDIETSKEITQIYIDRYNNFVHIAENKKYGYFSNNLLNIDDNIYTYRRKFIWHQTNVTIEVSTNIDLKTNFMTKWNYFQEMAIECYKIFEVPIWELCFDIPGLGGWDIDLNRVSKTLFGKELAAEGIRLDERVKTKYGEKGSKLIDQMIEFITVE